MKINKRLIIIATLILFNCFLFAGSEVYAWSETDTPAVKDIIGGFTGNGEFDYPYGVSVDADGNIYVADTENNRIQKFDSSGNFILKFGSEGSGDGQFDWPLSIDADGNIYVADTGNHRIQKFDSSGNFILRFGTRGSEDGQFCFPVGVSIDADGNIYVTDSGNDRIQKFDSSGNFLMKFGSRGSGDGEFRSPGGVGVSDEYVYLADTGNHRIQKFDSSGNFILKFGSKGSGDGQFNYPHRVSINADGNIYVVDASNHRVQIFQFDRRPANLEVSKDPFEGEDGNYYLEGTATDDLTPITSIQYQISDGESEWVDCEAVVGAFDELEEEFICNLGSGYEPGSSTEVYIRSTDSRTNTNSTLGTGESTDIAVAEISILEELPETGRNISLLYSTVLLTTLLLTVYYRKRLIGCNEC